MSTKPEDVIKKELPSDNSPLPLAGFYEGQQPAVRSLFKTLVKSVSDVTFGNAAIAKYIQDGFLSVSDGVIRVSPSIQNDDAFSWWITTLISFIAKSMLSIEGLSAKDRTEIYSDLCKLSHYLSGKGSESGLKQSSSSCNKCCRRKKSNESQSANDSAATKTKKKCPGSQCPTRKRMKCSFEAQAPMIKKFWHVLRQSIQRVLRGNPLFSSDLKKTDKESRLIALTIGITALSRMDPHQLFKKFERVSTEHVMHLKVSLWEILVTPNKEPRLKKYYDMKSPSNVLGIAQAKLFIKALLDEFAKFQEAVKNVSLYLTILDDEYLKQFGVTWKIVNHYIFDKVIYQDELFKSFLPHMESALQVQLTDDGTGNSTFTPSTVNEDCQKQFPELFSGILELAKSFQLFHRLMLTSREMFRRADLLMQTFTKQQQFLHNKAKVEILEKDLNFFTQQRKMVREFVCEPNKCNDSESVINNYETIFDDNLPKRELDDETDEAEFVQRFKDLLDCGLESTRKCKMGGNGRETVCKYCNQSHCWCDECSLYHMVICGLIDCEIDSSGPDMMALYNIFSLNGIFESENEIESNDNDKDVNISRSNSNESANFLSAKDKPLSDINDDNTKTINKCSDESLNELQPLPLFTLHETTEQVDSQSDWDVGSFDPFATCDCEKDFDEKNYSYMKSFLSLMNSSIKKPQEQRLSSRVTTRKNFVQRRGKSATTITSGDKKSIVQVDKKGICVTQITKSTSRGMFISKGVSKEVCIDSCSDDIGESSDEGDDIKVDIQQISESIVREIEKSLANDNDESNNAVAAVAAAASIDNSTTGNEKNLLASSNKDCFSSFFGSGCRKLIEVMKKSVESGSARSTVLEEDTDESLSVDSSVGRCSHGHDHHDSCQGVGDESRERFSRCDCCYCTYMTNDMPSRHDGRRNEEIRQRLRKVLKQREEKSNNRTANSVSSDTRVLTTDTQPTTEKFDGDFGYIGDKPVDEILEILNSNKFTETNLPPAKAAKKARQKQRRMDEKLKKAEEERIRKEKENAEKLRKQKEEELIAAEAAKKLEEEAKNQKKESNKNKAKRKHNENSTSETSVLEKENHSKAKEKKSNDVDNRPKDSITPAKSQQQQPSLTVTTTNQKTEQRKADKKVVSSTKVSTIAINADSTTPTSVNIVDGSQIKKSFANITTTAVKDSNEQSESGLRNGNTKNKNKVKNEAIVVAQEAKEEVIKKEKSETRTTTKMVNIQQETQSTKKFIKETSGKNSANANKKEQRPQKPQCKSPQNISAQKGNQKSTPSKEVPSTTKSIKPKQPSTTTAATPSVIQQQLLQSKFSQDVKSPIPQRLPANSASAIGTIVPQMKHGLSGADQLQTNSLTSSFVPVAPTNDLVNSQQQQNSSLADTKKTSIADDEMQYLRQRAALIASAAAAAGTPLPPLSSLSSEQQQKYFAWIKQLQSSTNSEFLPRPPFLPSLTTTTTTAIVTNKESTTQPDLLSSQQDENMLNKLQQEQTILNNNELSSLLPLSTSTGVFSAQNVGTIGSGRPNSTIPRVFPQKSEATQQISSSFILPQVQQQNKSLSPLCHIHPQTFQQPKPFSVPVATATTICTPVGRYGAIGEKPPQRKTFNQYAAYDRETNHILGLSQSPLNSSAIHAAGSSLPNGSIGTNPLMSSSFTGNSSILNSSSIHNGGSGGADSLLNIGFADSNTFQRQQHRPNSISLVSGSILGASSGGNDHTYGIKNENIQFENLPISGICQPNVPQQINDDKPSQILKPSTSSSIWQNDDEAKRFVESEECAVFKFSEY